MFTTKGKFFGISGLITPLFNNQKLFRLKGAPPFLPFYHLASDRNPAYIRHLYPVKSVARFEKELDFILSEFEPVDVKELINITGERHEAKERVKPVVHFSFDDGLSEVYENVVPILKRKGVPATFFINPSFLDDKDLFYRYRVSLLFEEINENRVNNAQLKTFKELLVKNGYFKGDLKNSLLMLDYSHKDLIRNICRMMLYEWENEKIYMSSDDVKKLVSEGFTIGAHSIDHPRYNAIDLEMQKKQTKESIDMLVEQFKLKYRLFAFPFTDHGVSLEFFEWLHDPGHPVADLSFGTAGLKHSAVGRHFHRIPMEESNLPPAKRIKAEYIYYLISKIFGNEKVNYTNLNN